MIRPKVLFASVLLALSFCTSADNSSGLQYSISDFGGIGLLQTPTARMFDSGEVGIFLTNTDQYRHQGLLAQPLDWLQVTFKYTDIDNINYSGNPRFSTLSYKDKSIDAKFSLADESHYVPKIAFGINDIGGTGLFSSEYFVSSKRFGDFDTHFGIGWGYLGRRGDIKNPFSLLLGDAYDDRFIFIDIRDKKFFGKGGTVAYKNMLKGSPSFFGGIEYQTPWQPLVLKLEYDANDYKNEPRKDLQKTASEQDFPLNIGAVYHINSVLDFQAGYERGNIATFGLSMHTNFGDKQKPTSKIRDPLPERLLQPEKIPASTPFNANTVKDRLNANSGYYVSEISFRDQEVVMRGQQTKFFDPAKGMGRAVRILHNSVGNDIKWITIVDESQKMPVKETTFSRETFVKAAQNDLDIDGLRRTTTVIPNSSQPFLTVNRFEHVPALNYGIGLGLEDVIGGPDQSILWEINLQLFADFNFTPDFWWSGGISKSLIGNYDEYKVQGKSRLPRVRTLQRDYSTAEGIVMPHFQLSYTKQLSDDIYSLWYTGMLETMFGGTGGEVLYRPFGERYAIGMDMNWVKQRDFEQDFSYRNYSIITGHITTYWDTLYENVLIATSVGRYLAGDAGITIDVSRSFKNGARFGAWATKTNVSAKEFGEGSFDKGLYISAPFDLLISTSTRKNMNFKWRPITRDGGAKLRRRYELYQMTSPAGDLNSFYDNFDHILD